MATFTPLISVSGVASCVVGGIIHLIAWTKGKEASQLESLKEIDKLSGAVLPTAFCVPARMGRKRV